MDHGGFDRLAKALGAAATRRSGLRAALGLALGLPAAANANANANAIARDTGERENERSGRAKPRPEGPCGDRSRKDNICTKDKQCCTNYCKKKLNNKDGKGRCRCIRKKRPCKPNQTCCGRYICLKGICTRPKAGIATGKACAVGGDTCENAAATCTTYYQSAPLGDYCLLPGGKACAAATDCRSSNCASGVCVDETCDVCAAGCPHTTVQAAITAAGAGAVIRIGAGTYAEDLTVPDMNLTLTNCNGGAVTLKNVADNTRTLVLGTSADPAPHQTVTIRNLTVTGKGTPVALSTDPDPEEPAAGDGGIMAYTNLILEGYAKVTGCNFRKSDDSYGGGVSLGCNNEALTLTLRGAAEVSDNFTGGYGGGIGACSYAGSLIVMEDQAAVTRNVARSDGGGIYLSGEVRMQMGGDAVLSYNRVRGLGGGIYVYGGGDTGTGLTMSGNARIVSNTAFYETTKGLGVYLYNPAATPAVYALEMHDNALIADNAWSGSRDDSGAGLVANNDDCKVLMDGNAQITRNAGGINYTGGAGNVTLDIRGSAKIYGNTPSDCKDTTLEPGSKACGA